MATDYDYADTPTLHYDVLNSQARSCCMLVKLLKIDMDFQQTDTLDITNFNDIYSWINSFCTLPLLMDGKITLCSGHSILIYLCKKYAPSNMQTLCPMDYASRIKLTSMLFYEGFILQRCLTHLLTDIFLANYPNFDEEYHKKKVFSIYTSLNSYLKKQNYLTGNRLTIADISAVATVSAFNIIFPIDYDKFPKLFDWLQGLRKMQFYNVNEEGIHKLRGFLKNVCQFPFPSPFCYKPSGCPETPRYSDEAMYEQHKSLNDPELNKYFDSYCVNVSKCKCCSNIVVKSKSDLDQNEFQNYNDIAKYLHIPDQAAIPKKLEKKWNSEETQEIYRRQNSCECRSSAETFGMLERPTKGDIGKETSFCHCYSKLCQLDKEINRTKKHTNNRRLSRSSDTSLPTVDHVPYKTADKIPRSNDKDPNIMDTKITPKEPNIMDAKITPKEPNIMETKITHKESIITDTKITQTDDATVPPEYRLSTNEKIQELMETIEKYEKILEMSDRALIDNKENLAVIPSDISIDKSIASEQIKLSEKSDQISDDKSDSIGSEVESYLESASRSVTDTENETLTGVETLTGTETPITEPTITETTVTETESESESESESELESELETTTQTQTESITNDSSFSTTESDKKKKRLKGGFSPDPDKSRQIFFMSFEKFKKTNKDFDEKISHIGIKNGQIIYVLYPKSNCTELNNYCCNDCCKKIKTIKSKIPRLVSNKSLTSNKNYKTSKLLTKENGCGVSTQTT